MKRIGFCLLIIVFLSFPAYASTLEFGSSLKTEYNLGDSLSIDGKIISGGEVSGLFQLNIVCNNQATNIVKSKQLRLSIDEQYTFNEVMNLPVNGQGKCLVNGKFDDVDADSHEFTITRDLKGSFDISKANLQLGEGFSFFGSIQKLNDLPMNGLATISIINSGQIYDVNTVEVKNGEMNYSYDAENIPAGRYYISVAANDVFGNERIFDNVAGFDVYNGLKISALLDKKEILPGESVEIEGSVKYENGDYADGETELLLNGNPAALSSGNFKNTISTASNMKSGKTSIVLKASDDHGNFGEGIIDFNVIPVPTKLVVDKNKEDYYPGEDVEVSSKLYDQADDEIQNDALVTIENPDGDVVEKGVGEIKFTLDAQAMPGTWNIDADQGDIQVKDKFIVKEVANLSVVLSGQDVLVKNIGNVDFDNDVVVKIDDDVLNQRLNLELNEEYTIELDRFYGDKEVVVFILGNKQSLGKVHIEDRRGFFGKVGDQLSGNVVSEGNNDSIGNPWVYAAVIGVLIGIVGGFYVYKRRTENYYDSLRNMEKKEASKYAQEIRKIREKEQKPKKKYFFGGKPMKEEDVKDFREQMIQRVQEEDKKGRGAYESRNRDGNDKPRMFR